MLSFQRAFSITEEAVKCRLSKVAAWTDPALCDEVHPVCGSCQRHMVTCVYDQRKSDGIVPGLQTVEIASASVGTSDAGSTASFSTFDLRALTCRNQVTDAF